MKQILLGQAIGRVTKIFLAPMGPLQHIFDSPGITHVHCLEEAYEFLRQDSHADVATFFQPYHAYLSKGLYWADRGWKNVYHFYSKPDKNGAVLWPGADAECQYYFNKAMAFMEKDVFKGMFFLGAALHLIQDMCVPHHSRGIIFDGHQEFEKWAAKNRALFPARNREGAQAAALPGGSLRSCYEAFSHPSQFIEHNAKISARYYPLVSTEMGCSETTYAEAARVLLPLTVYASAGFLNFVRGNLTSVTLKLF